MTDTLPASAREAAAAATAALDARGLVVLPAGGRYAIAADALDDDAIARVFEATARPADAAPSVAVADLEDARHVARVTPAARQLASEFLPGPVVVLLPARATAPDFLVGAGGAVAIRVPPEDAARALARAFGPFTVPRAAKFGLPAPLSPADSTSSLASTPELVLDAGRLAGARATVVDATGPVAQVVREGDARIAFDPPTPGRP